MHKKKKYKRSTRNCCKRSKKRKTTHERDWKILERMHRNTEVEEKRTQE